MEKETYHISAFIALEWITPYILKKNTKFLPRF